MLWDGLAFTLRNFVQSSLGKRVGRRLDPRRTCALLRGGTIVGVGVRVRFLISETLDFVVYTPLVERRRIIAAVLLSNTVGLLLDTLTFLWLAFHSLTFWQGPGHRRGMDDGGPRAHPIASPGNDRSRIMTRSEGPRFEGRDDAEQVAIELGQCRAVDLATKQD